MNLGKRLKYARDKRKLTQEQLEELSGVSQAAISALETRDSKRTEFAAQLATALRIPLEWLQDGGPEPVWLEGSTRSGDDPEITPEVLELAKKIARMPSQKRKLLMEIFSRGVADDDPRLKDWDASGK